MSDFKEFCIVEKLSPVQIVGARKAWQEQQAIIDDLQKTIVSLEAGLRKNSSNKQKLLSKNIDLQKRVGELEHYKRDGFAVVPVDPTPKMIDSTWDHDDDIHSMSSNERNEFIYRKMIAPYVK